MLKQDYLSRLTRAARWRLGGKDADEIIEDYRDIIGHPPRPEEELARDIGRPKDVVMQLTTPKKYRVWLVVFAVLAACPALMALDVLRVAVAHFLYQLTGQLIGWLWADLMRETQQLDLLLLGLVLSFVWFQRRGRKGTGGLPRGVLPCLGALTLLVVLAWVCWFMLCRMVEDSSVLTPALFGAVRLVLEWGPPISCTIALVGLLKARTGDRRWRAVYALGLTATAVLLAVNAILNNMDSSFFYSPWWSPETRHILLLTVLGLIGTGAALC